MGINGTCFSGISDSLFSFAGHCLYRRFTIFLFFFAMACLLISMLLLLLLCCRWVGVVVTAADAFAYVFCRNHNGDNATGVSIILATVPLAASMSRV